MSDDLQKADQIAHHLYTKLAAVVHDGRTLPEPGRTLKTEKWFNLELSEPGTFREYTLPYRAVSSLHTVPPFELQVLLVVPELGNNQALVYRAPDSSRVRVEPTPRHVLLESWMLSFSQTASSVQPATMYKHGISLFRSIFTLLRLLPAWSLLKKHRRRPGLSSLSLQLRAVRAGAVTEPDVLSFATRPAPGVAPLQTSIHVFPPVPHPTGTLAISVTYLSAPSFELNELESLLSSRFLSLDEGPEFTPTLSARPRESPGGAPEASASRSPPRSAAAIAERFVLPATAGQSHRRTTSFSTQSTRPGITGAPSGTSPSAASVVSNSSRGSAVESATLASARQRRESTPGRELPSAPAPNAMPIKRPTANLPLFKTSTLSSGSPSIHSGSPSFRHASPLSTAVGGAPPNPSPASPSGRVPPSPITTQGLPTSLGRPSFPGSLGEARETHSPSVESPRLPTTTKRYSSTFGVSRQTAAAATASALASPALIASEPLGASSPVVSQRAGSASFMNTSTEDDDISLFVQDIDARAPLRGHRRGSSLPLPPGRSTSALSAPPGISTTNITSTATGDATGQGHDRDTTFRLPGPGLMRSDSTGSSSQAPRVPSSLGPSRPSRISEVTESSTMESAASDPGVDITIESESPVVAPMLTRPSDVDARLREMNEAFMASLAGLGTGSSSIRRDSQTASPAPSRTPATSGSSSMGGDSLSRLTRDSSRRASSISSQEVLGKLDLSGRSERR